MGGVGKATGRGGEGEEVGLGEGNEKAGGGDARAAGLGEAGWEGVGLGEEEDTGEEGTAG